MRLAVFTKNRSNPAYAAARLGAERAAALGGAEITHYVPQTPDDPGEQSALIDEALATKPDAIVLSVVHATRVNDAVQRIHAVGIPVTGFVNPVPVGRSAAYVGADDASLARAMAGYLFDHLQGQGRVLVVMGPEDSVTSIDRLRGFMAAFESRPGVTLAGQIAGGYDREKARSAMAKWMASNGTPDACLVANDIMAIGVLDALDAADARSIVVGVNAIPQAVEAIGAGRMLATADFNAMQMAYLATDCAIRHLQGLPVPEQLELAVRIVDGSNWREWHRPYEARTLHGVTHFWSPP
ncbi:MAG: sugar ABC transporter substrate-binding protein [Bordetella sp.]|nr:sugar ABC transporter substrate-binding protein [Bordetella sp.]